MYVLFPVEYVTVTMTAAGVTIVLTGGQVMIA